VNPPCCSRAPEVGAVGSLDGGRQWAQIGRASRTWPCAIWRFNPREGEPAGGHARAAASYVIDDLSPLRSLTADKLGGRRGVPRHASNALADPATGAALTREAPIGRATTRPIPTTDSGMDDHGFRMPSRGQTGFSAIVWGGHPAPKRFRFMTFANASRATGGTLVPGSTARLRGVLPAWCMEARSDNYWTKTMV